MTGISCGDWNFVSLLWNSVYCIREMRKKSCKIPLDFAMRKRYDKFQLHICDEKEEYLRRIFREPPVGVRRQCEAEKGALEQFFHKRGLILSANEGGTAEDF